MDSRLQASGFLKKGKTRTSFGIRHCWEEKGWLSKGEAPFGEAGRGEEAAWLHAALMGPGDARGTIPCKEKKGDGALPGSIYPDATLDPNPLEGSGPNRLEGSRVEPIHRL